MEIVPSILSADPGRLSEQVREACEAGVRWVQIDIMDGHFVPNLTFGPATVAALRPVADAYGATLDAHLMVTNPDHFIEEFASAGADIITVHAEACVHLHRTVHSVRAQGKKAGVALNPATSLVALEEILPDIDLALLMTVNPGFGGQRFIPSVLNKIERLRATLQQRGLTHIAIQVDGGVNLETVPPLVRAGATAAVIGSAVYNDKRTVAENVALLRDTIAAARA